MKYFIYTFQSSVSLSDQYNINPYFTIPYVGKDSTNIWSINFSVYCRCINPTKEDLKHTITLKPCWILISIYLSPKLCLLCVYYRICTKGTHKFDHIFHLTICPMIQAKNHWTGFDEISYTLCHCRHRSVLTPVQNCFNGNKSVISSANRYNKNGEICHDCKCIYLWNNLLCIMNFWWQVFDISDPFCDSAKPICKCKNYNTKK